MTITQTKDTTAATFDTKRFKEDYPELYEQYLKQSRRKGSLKITLK